VIATLGPKATEFQQSPGPAVWRYPVQVFNGAGDSAWSGYTGIRPAVPSGLAGSSPMAGPAKLTWSDNSAFEASFQLQRQQFKGGKWVASSIIGPIGANTTSFTDSPGTGRSRYRERSSNFNGPSRWTGWVIINVP
jgi:hypothetical protein